MTPHRSPTTANTSRATALLALAAARRPPSTRCLDDEQLALFIDGRSGNEQQNLLDHLAHCPDCYQRWLLASDNRSALRGRLRRLRPLGLALAAAACLVLYLQVVELDKTPIAPLPAAPQAVLPEKTSADKAESSSLPTQTKNGMPLQDKKGIPEVELPKETVPAIPLPAPAPKADGGVSPPPAERLKGKAAAPPAAERAPAPAPIATLPEAQQLRSLEKEKKAAVAPPQQEARPAEPLPVPSSAPAGASRDAARSLAETATAPAPPGTELDQWRRDLAEACRRHESDVHAWRLLLERGQRLQHSHGAVDTALFALIQGIEGADSVVPVCRHILDELAKNGMDK